MLSCKDVAYLASDYLDKNLDGTLPWKIRLHLVACRCCRRFVKHLKLTNEVVPQFVHRHREERRQEHGQEHSQEIDAEAVLKRIKARH